MLISHISQKEVDKSQVVQGNEIRKGVYDLIQAEFPDFTFESIISLEELNVYRRIYLTQLVEQERGELAVIDFDVMKAIRDNLILSENLQDKAEGALTFG